MSYLKSQSLPIKLLFFGGNECQFCADVLYRYCKGSELYFVVPTYPISEYKQRIKNYVQTRYPDVTILFIDCSDSCRAVDLSQSTDPQRSGCLLSQCPCTSVLAPFRDLEHINVVYSAYMPESISQCDQCKHIVPDAYGLCRPKADGSQGRVWNYYLFYGLTDTQIARVTRRSLLGDLSQVICPVSLNRLIAWWIATLNPMMSEKERYDELVRITSGGMI